MHGSARRRATALALAALALAIGTAGCSSAGPAASAGSASPAATASGALPTEAPTPTAWPGNVPDAVIALGKLDEQMAKAAKAMDDAVSAEDFAALSAASQGLVNLVDGYSESLQTIQGYAGTRQLGDTFAEALGKIRTGAQAIVDGIEKGEATAIDAGVTDLGAGIAQYGLARKALGPFLEQAISMKKKYVK
ncbi:MAG: hypothetical protein MUE82_02350 [Chloroflexi bacterium]|jgi:hypothetical protein|nr:hypothetical protein [Chloroflexota bacterium]